MSSGVNMRQKSDEPEINLSAPKMKPASTKDAGPEKASLPKKNPGLESRAQASPADEAHDRFPGNSKPAITEEESDDPPGYPYPVRSNRINLRLPYAVNRFATEADYHGVPGIGSLDRNPKKVQYYHPRVDEAREEQATEGIFIGSLPLITTSRTPEPKSIFIAVMGATGVGKSTFVSLCCDEELKPRIGDEMQSCTERVEVYTCSYDQSTTIFLIDTPGFDDTTRSETDVLREIAGWLTTSYSSGKQLSGILYLHRISDRRMTGSGVRNLHMFRQLCGQDALNRVILVTTMWEDVNEVQGQKRVQELETREEFWGAMLKHGSRVERHYNNQESAITLLGHIMNSEMRENPIALDLQRQMVEEGKTLPETSAGMVVEDALEESRAKAQEEINKLRQDLQMALAAKDSENAQRLEHESKRMNARVQDLNKESQRLRGELEELKMQKEADMEDVMRRADERHRQAMEALEEVTRMREQAYREESMRSADSETTESHDTELPPSLRHIAEAAAKEIFVTMFGKRYYLRGSKTDKWNMGHPALSLPIVRVEKRQEDNHVVEFGYQEGIWYQHYHDVDWMVKRRCQNRTSPRIQDKYAKFSIISQNLGSCPEAVSLGMNGNFFLKLPDGTMHFDLSVPTQESIGDMRDLKRMFFGIGGAYLAVMNDGEARWNFQGSYPDLEEVLYNAPSTWEVQNLCLDMSCYCPSGQWIIVWSSGRYDYRLCEDCSVPHLGFILPQWFKENNIYSFRTQGGEFYDSAKKSKGHF